MEEQEQSRLDKIRKIQLAELELVKVFINICEKNNLRYYMSGGTMLGAVRHKGYIPWDDDADFMMPREDYEKFLKLAPATVGESYKVVNFIFDNNYIFYFTRLCSVDKGVKITSSSKERIDNIWIDILPLDGMPNNKFLFLIHKFVLLANRALFHYALFDEVVTKDKPNRPWYEKILVYLGVHFNFKKLFSHKKRWRALDRALKKYPFGKSDIWVNFMGGYKLKEMFSKSVLGEGTKYSFEGMELYGVNDYDTYLSALYGDYMTPPPESERFGHIASNLEIIDL